MKSVIRSAVVAIAALLTVTGVTTVTSPANGGGTAAIIDVSDECAVCWE